MTSVRFYLVEKFSEGPLCIPLRSSEVGGMVCLMARQDKRTGMLVYSNGANQST